MKSLEVTVLKRPHIQVLPLSVSVLEDAPVLCTCLSRDDKTGDFVYTWWKDNEILIAGPNDEIVEDLYPTGSRIRVRSAKVSAVYTCEVESPSGKSREECHLSVSPCKFCKNSLACIQYKIAAKLKLYVGHRCGTELYCHCVAYLLETNDMLFTICNKMKTLSSHFATFSRDVDYY